MLNTVFYTLINMSILASLIGLLILILRKIKPIPRQFIYWMWALVIIKLIIPFSISSRFSILNYSGFLVKKVITVPGMPESSINLSVTNSIGAAEDYFPVSFKTEQLQKIFSAASCIWIIGAAGSVILSVVIYFITLRRLKSAIKNLNLSHMLTGGHLSFIDKSGEYIGELSAKATARVYISDLIDTPMVMGIFQQSILIPKDYLIGSGFKHTGLKYIILHENVHIKRKDNFIRMVFILAACLHWFNPLVWIFMSKFSEDMELSCDLRAVKGLTSDERKNYAQTLLAAGTERQHWVMSAYGNSSIGKRVINVLNYKKLSVFSLVVMLIFFAASAAVLLTNPIN